MPRSVKLPNKPSALIRLALKDLSAVEKMKAKYRVDMEVWHEPNSHCTVCFAGSVMACSLKADPKENLDYDAFGKENKKKLLALNYFRTGDLHDGLNKMEADYDDEWIPYSVAVSSYDATDADSKKDFKKDMNKIADRLEAFDL
jgi:hypothetical protein